MRRIFFIISISIWTCVAFASQCLRNPFVTTDLLNRIGGKGTASRFEIVLDKGMKYPEETFIIGNKKGKPMITGSSMSAVTAGIGWYLNHYAHVNISWNNLTTDLSTATFPLPENEERHTCNATFRYYLNYCTFGYSMTTWTWDRWQKEIDWMALHGINMPLQIIGLEQVWKSFLMEDCNYSEEDAEAFVPGPAFTGWWGMNNLQGWGGDAGNASTGVKDNAWYQRQTALAKKILSRERELGIEPVLPGFSGMVPSDLAEKTGYSTEKANKWCGFQRPAIIDPTSKDFGILAQRYYKQLEKVMGKSLYYSMDPFHEGGTISSGKYAEGYRAVYDAMNEYAGENSKWVIQQWQWASNNYQRTSLTAVPGERLIVLDLFSDGDPQFDRFDGYKPQYAVYCAIPNFGGRTGLFGRIPKMADNYFHYKEKYSSVQGIGAAPEAIEQTPIVYDLLFELPWMDSKPDCREWIAEYVKARYNTTDNKEATEAWELILQTALNNTTTLQGPHEAVVCARPSLEVNAVSAWGGTDIFYKDNIKDFIEANKKLMEADITSPLGKANYSYDLCDITRQTLTDYAYSLLKEIKEASKDGTDLTNTLYINKRDEFLGLILDLDDLLATNQMFRLGNWTETARKAAAEVKGATTADADWYELNNARTLITTWGDKNTSENVWLHDYSYREWQGMLRDFYYPRWQYFFSHDCKAPEDGWFQMDWNWAHDASKKYSTAPEGDTREKALKYFNKYIVHK